MKKILVMMLCVAFLFSLSACGNDGDEIRHKEDKNITETTPKKSKKEKDVPKGLQINSYYLDLLGEEKEDIDELLGIGEYSYEFGMTDYKNGVMIGWNSIGTDPDDDSEAVCISLTLENIFHNCPESLTQEEITSLFPDSYVEYSPMDDENVLNVNYKGMTLSFYPDLGLKSTSHAFINSSNKYALPSGEYFDGEISDEDIRSDEDYYEYALAHDEEFWNINKDWRDDREYYYLSDVDQDSRKEMVVKLGCGIAIYKKTGSGVEEVFRNTLPESSGSVSYYVANYDGVDYIAYNSASSSEYTVLYKLSGKELVKARVSQCIDGEYFIDDASVSWDKYDKYLNSIEYPSGMAMEKLK